MRRMHGAGYACHAVGGCVRDGLRGEIPHDYDVATSALPQEVLQVFSHLPVIVDPSHATGVAKYVKPMAFAAAACGAAGLMIEVHNDPKHALCDGPQSLTPEQFGEVAEDVKRILDVVRA